MHSEPFLCHLVSRLCLDDIRANAWNMKTFRQSRNLSFCFMEFKNPFKKINFSLSLELARHTTVCQDESFVTILKSSDHTFVSFMLSRLRKILGRPKLKNKNSQAAPTRLSGPHLPLFVEHAGSLLLLHSFFSKDPAGQGSHHFNLGNDSFEQVPDNVSDLQKLLSASWWLLQSGTLHDPCGLFSFTKVQGLWI